MCYGSLSSISNVHFTYSNDIQGVVAHFSNFSVLVVHQIYEVGRRLWSDG